MGDTPKCGWFGSKVAAFTRRWRKEWPGKPVLMGAMMEKLDIDFQQVHEMGLADELALRARICSRCLNHEECRERLRKEDVPEFRDICSNRTFFEEVGSLRCKTKAD